MKFATRLDFNAHPDWKDSYINYEKLKKLIYAKEIEETRGHSLALTGSDNRTSLGSASLQRVQVIGSGPCCSLCYPALVKHLCHAGGLSCDACRASVRHDWQCSVPELVLACTQTSPLRAWAGLSR